MSDMRKTLKIKTRDEQFEFEATLIDIASRNQSIYLGFSDHEKNVDKFTKLYDGESFTLMIGDVQFNITELKDMPFGIGDASVARAHFSSML